MIVTTQAFLPFYILFLVAGTAERVFSTFSKNQKAISKRSLGLAWFYVPFYCYLLIIVVSVIEFFFKINQVDLVGSGLGFFIYGIGVLLRRSAIKGLKQSWSVYSEIQPNQTLVQGGIYRFLKHPYYLAVILELIGAGLVAGAYLAVLLVFILQVPILVARIFFEEKLLQDYFGNEYKKYAKGKLF